MKSENRYQSIIRKVFHGRHKRGARVVHFSRENLVEAARKLNISLPKNLGDIISSFRFRTPLPESIAKLAPPGKEWTIKLSGKGKYRFEAVGKSNIEPRHGFIVTKIPDSTPSVINRYAMDDEQALLAKLRYNRLIDIFTGVTCYSLQNHLRTTVPGMGQVETDEIYIGIDKRGAHYVIPVQAKAGKDKQSIVQIEQDIGICAAKFGNLIAKPVAAQFMADDVIALMEFEKDGGGVVLSNERHYRLVPADQLSEKDLAAYAARKSD